MRKVRTRPWDAADYLKTDADMDAYLEAALEDGDPQLITAALGDIAKARGMTKIATSTDFPENNPRHFARGFDLASFFPGGIQNAAGGIYRLLWPRNRLERTSACVVWPEYPIKANRTPARELLGRSVAGAIFPVGNGLWVHK